MQNFHSEYYPKLKQSMMKVGQDLSTPDFQVTIFPQTKAKGTKFSSSYVCRISIWTSDEVSEEELIRYINETDWQQIIKQKLCKYHPEAKEVENGIYIPSIKGTIEIPDTIFSKYNVREA